MAEVTLVEGSGGPAEDRANGYWIDTEHMGAQQFAMHCIPGNCISCDDAADRALQHMGQLDAMAPNDFAQLLGRAGAKMNNMRVDVSNVSGVPLPLANATCDHSTGSTLCLGWQYQVIGTCCRLGHHGTLCAHCDDGWVKAKGLCMPCQSFFYWKLFLMIAVYVGICIFFWRKATRLKKPADVDEQCQSATNRARPFPVMEFSPW
jgi:hypothetical protein